MYIKCHNLITVIFVFIQGSLGLSQRKNKGGKASTASVSLVAPGARYGEGTTAANGGLTLRDPVTGAQYVQIQLLQVRSC